MGLLIGYNSSCYDRCGIFKPIKELNKWFSNPGKKKNHLYHGLNGFNFYGSAFTPDSLGTKSIVYGDRPYSSLMGLAFCVSSLKEKGPKHRKSRGYTNISVGAIGFRVQGKLQALIHSDNKFYKDTIAYVNPVYPYGWINQISDGGKFTMLLQSGQSFLITDYYLKAVEKSPVNKRGYRDGEIYKIPWYKRFFELRVGYEFMLGYYNNFQLNSQFRMGLINPTKWVNPVNSLSQASNFTNQSLNHKFSLPRRMELYLYGSIAANAMMYNSLLRGQWIYNNQDVYLMKKSEINPLFLEVHTGVGLAFKGVNFYFSPFILRTSEIKSGKYARNHIWAKAGLVFNFNCP